MEHGRDYPRGRRRWRGCHPHLCAVTLLSAAVLSTQAIDVPGTEDIQQMEGDTLSAATREKTGGWELQGHSFRKQLTYDDNLALWTQSAATMALRDRVMLLPRVADRHGLLWHKEAINSSDFSITLQVRLNSTNSHVLLGADAHTTFWLSPDNLLQSYDEAKVLKFGTWEGGLESQGLTFRGNKPNFRGLMVSFAREGQAAPAPSAPFGSPVSAAMEGVTVAWNNGENYPGNRAAKKAAQSRGVAPDSGFAPITWAAVTLVEVTIRVSLPNVITVGLKQHVGNTHLEKNLFTLQPSHGKISGWEGTFMGFTGYSGRTSSADVNVELVKVVNYDATRIGESLHGGPEAASFPAPQALTGLQDWQEVLSSEKRYISQRSQSEALEKLTQLLTDHINDFNEMGREVQSKLVELGSRLDILETNLGSTVAGLDAFDVESGTIFVSNVKDHMVRLKKAFEKLGTVHDEKVTQVEQTAQMLKQPDGKTEAAKQARRNLVESASAQVSVLEDQVSRSSWQTGWMLLSLLISVIGLGVLFLRRMRYYEKKHFI